MRSLFFMIISIFLIVNCSKEQSNNIVAPTKINSLHKIEEPLSLPTVGAILRVKTDVVPVKMQVDTFRIEYGGTTCWDDQAEGPLDCIISGELYKLINGVWVLIDLFQSNRMKLFPDSCITYTESEVVATYGDTFKVDVHFLFYHEGHWTPCYDLFATKTVTF